MRKFIVPYMMSLAAIVSLAACSTTEPYKKVVWANPQVPPDMQHAKLNADAKECWSLAAQAVPEPSLTQMGMKLRDRLGWQILNQRDEKQEYLVAVCLAQKGWRAEERIVG